MSSLLPFAGSKRRARALSAAGRKFVRENEQRLERHIVDNRAEFRRRAIADLCSQIESKAQLDAIVASAQPSLQRHVRALLEEHVTFVTASNSGAEFLVNPAPNACCGRTPFWCTCAEGGAPIVLEGRQ